jgi:rsbT co-antagonist protein RsbR
LNADELATKAATLEEQIAALTQQLERQEELHRRVVEERNLLRAAFEAMPVGVVVVDVKDEFHMCNAAMRSIFAEPADISHASHHGDIYLPDGVTKVQPERDPIHRALHGQSVDNMESVVRHSDTPEQTMWIVQSSQPIFDEHGAVRACVVVTRDITEHKELVRELDEVVAATVEEKRVLIEKLEAGVKALSTPIIEVWDDVLALPVIGAVDERRGAEMTSRLLDEIVNRGVQSVIVDWTGVETMDGQSAQHLLDLVRSVELVGAECILTGIRPAVATALLDLDVRFEHMRLLRNLKYGLRYCLGRVQQKALKTKAHPKAVRSSSSSTH